MASRHVRSSRPLRLVVLSIALAVLAPLSAALAEGFYYESTTSDRLENGKERMRNVVRGWIDGANAKIEFADQKGTMFKPGSYLLTKDGGRTLYLIDPKEKAYSRWDLEAMLASTFALMEGMGPLLNVEFANATSKKLDEGDGGSVLGYPTRRYKWESAYDMKMTVIGMKRQYHLVSVQEFWSTTGIDAEGFKVWLRPDRTRTGNSQLDSILSDEIGKVQGFPLKSVTHATMTTGKGKEQKSVITMEVTTLREESVPASTFEMPQGYEERPFLPGMPPPEGGK
jgi:hypothetical protein